MIWSVAHLICLLLFVMPSLSFTTRSKVFGLTCVVVFVVCFFFFMFFFFVSYESQTTDCKKKRRTKRMEKRRRKKFKFVLLKRRNQRWSHVTRNVWKKKPYRYVCMVYGIEEVKSEISCSTIFARRPGLTIKSRWKAGNSTFSHKTSVCKQLN